jgi:hypothetical protein
MVFSQSLSGSMKQLKVVPVFQTEHGLAAFLVPMSDGKTFTLAGRKVDYTGPLFAMEKTAREDFRLMFGQLWSVMRTKWTDSRGKPQEDVIVIMLLNREQAMLTREAPLAQLQFLQEPSVPLSGVAQRLFDRADDVREHAFDIWLEFSDKATAAAHIAGV